MKRNVFYWLLLSILSFDATGLSGQVVKLSQNASLDGILLNGIPVLMNSKSNNFFTTDGTEVGTYNYTGKVYAVNSDKPQGLVMGNQLFFPGNNFAQGVELWATNGTNTGTYLVKDINAGAGSSHPKNLSVLGNSLYFFADDGVHGIELWTSDGSEANTRLVKDINPGLSGCWSNSYSVMYAYKETLYFIASDGTHGYELWKTDGTGEGTLMIKDINVSGDAFKEGTVLTGLGDDVFFAANDGLHGTELWKTDGTESETELVKDIAEGNETSSSNPYGLILCGKKIFFSASLGVGSYKLYVTDGTTNGTLSVKSTLDGNIPINSGLFPIAVINDKILFPGLSDKYHRNLWVSDGTNDGTYVLKGINLDESTFPPDISVPNPLGYFIKKHKQPIFKGQAFLSATDSANGRQIWVTDGTSENTRVLKTLSDDSVGIDLNYLSHMDFFLTDSALYFSSKKSFLKNKIEIWKTDGTSEGTNKITDMTVATSNYHPLLFQFGFNSQLYFSCLDSTNYTGFRNLYKLEQPTKPLPVSLLEFKARLEKNTVLLTWRTSSEINSSHFEVLRSVDGARFNSIGKVAASGNAINLKSYQFIDNNVLNLNTDVLYYRLKMFDKDGRYKYSEIEPVRLKNLAPKVSVFPNPVANILNVAVKVGQVEDVYVSIVDIKGAVLFQKRASNPAPDFTIAIDVSKLPAGIYYLNLKTSKQNHSISFIKNQGG